MKIEPFWIFIKNFSNHDEAKKALRLKHATFYRYLERDDIYVVDYEKNNDYTVFQKKSAVRITSFA